MCKSFSLSLSLSLSLSGYDAELVGGKNTIGRKAAVLKKPYKATFKT